MRTIIFKEGLSVKIFISLAVILVTIGFLVMIRKQSPHLIWGIPFYIIFLWALLNIWQQEITIDEHQIVQKFSNFSKPKAMSWKNIDYVVKDGLDDFPICRLISKTIKPKTINISGIKNMNSLIIEIVKRAKNAEIDLAFRELAEKESKK